MRRIAALALMLSAAAAAGSALALPQTSDPLPTARASIEPGDALVSAPTTLTVEVLTPTFFRSAVRFPDTLPVDNAVVLMSSRGRANINERIDGRQWAGIRRAYLIYPTRPGRITIPPIDFQVLYGLPSGGASEPTPVATAPLSFEARVPAGMDPSRSFLATTSLTASQELFPSREALRVGDSIERRIRLSVDDTPGLFLPEPDFAAPAGARLYRGQPELVESGGERGTIRTAVRTDTATYLLQQEGPVELPEIRISWWNLSTGAVETETVPGTTYDVGPAPPPDVEFGAQDDPTAQEATEPTTAPWRQLGLGLIALGALGFILRGVMRRGAADRAPTPAQIETAAFAAVRSAISGGDLRETEAALLGWMQVRAARDVTPTLADLSDQASDPGLTKAVSQLQQRLYGRTPSPSLPAALLPAVERFRKAKPLDAPRAELPALNP
jgi:hypothetical protein